VNSGFRRLVIWYRGRVKLADVVISSRGAADTASILSTGSAKWGTCPG